MYKRLLFLLLLLSYHAYGWNSVGMVNHRQITQDSINLLNISNPNEFPDINKFVGGMYGSGIMDGSSAEASHIINGINLWGIEPEQLIYWFSQSDSLGRKAFLEKKFMGSGSCYYFIGFELHLHQDTFVPAHELVLYHRGLNQDEFEYLADRLQASSDFNYDNTTQPTGYLGLYACYLDDVLVSSEKYATIPAQKQVWFSAMPSDLYSPSWTFWLSDSQDDDTGNDDSDTDSIINDGPNEYQILTTWGSYGKGWISADINISPHNLLPGLNRGGNLYQQSAYNDHDDDGDWFDSYDNTIVKNYMMTQQLRAARDRTTELLKQYSKSLPPLVDGVEQSWNQENKEAIFRFFIQENRTQKVFVTIQFKIGEKKIYLTDGNNITWNNHEVILSLDMTNSDYLPYITKTGSDNFLEVRWIPELYPLPAHDKNEKIYLSIIATDQDDLISDPIESEITLDQHSAILDKRNYFQKFLDWFLDLFG